MSKKNSNSRPAIPDESPALALKNCFLFTALIFRYPDDTVYATIEQNLAVFTEFFTTYGGRVPVLPPIDDLQAEYVSLFVNNKGFVPAVPYASCHLDGGRLMGDSFYSLQQKMAETGFQLDSSVPELEDHLTILLEYAGNLVGSIVEKQRNIEESRIEADTLFDITDEYIRPVTKAVYEGIEEYATLDFYRITTRALRDFIRDTSSIYDAVLDF